MEGLKPCPFCGGKAQERWAKGKYSYMAFIQCTFCGAQTNVCKIPGETFVEHFCDEWGNAADQPYDDKFWNTEPFQVVSMRWNRRTNEGGKPDA